MRAKCQGVGIWAALSRACPVVARDNVLESGEAGLADDLSLSGVFLSVCGTRGRLFLRKVGELQVQIGGDGGVSDAGS